MHMLYCLHIYIWALVESELLLLAYLDKRLFLLCYGAAVLLEAAWLLLYGICICVCGMILNVSQKSDH